MTTATKNHEDT
jgi:Zn-dependent M16 (insulinase) family peptidase